jgi:DegV family protein with EDD domain
VSFLEGFEDLQNNGPVPLSVRKHLDNVEPPVSGLHVQSRHRHATEALEYRYCTEILLDNVNATADQVKTRLREMGDSLIVAQGKSRIRIHIHTNSPADVVQKSRRFGQVSQQKVDDMLRQEQAINDPKGKIAVLTDSIADIPGNILDLYQIHVLNLNLIWSDEEFLDRLTITPSVFYRQQLIRNDFPGSSVPDGNRVDGLYQFLLENYEGVIVLPVAKSLSGTWQQMVLSADIYNKDRKRIHVVDTCLNSAAQGLLVVEIAKAASSGTGLVQLVSLAESLKTRIKIYVSVSTFKYMVRGGRVSPLKGFAAALLNLKPIVSLDEQGKGIAFEKAFSRKGLMRKISMIIDRTQKNSGIERYVIVHASAMDGARQFTDVVKGITGTDPDYITDISPIVGMHSGRGAVAIGLIEEAS